MAGKGNANFRWVYWGVVNVNPESRATGGQPSLEELTARFMSRQLQAAANGLAGAPANDVEPYEAVPVQAVDPRQAWDEAIVAVSTFGATAAEIGKPISDWPQLVAAQPSVSALPLAAGNFPQMVRDLSPIFHSERLSDLLTRSTGAVEVAGFENWTSFKDQSATFPRKLLSVGVLRLVRMFDAANRELSELKKCAPNHWRSAIANEEAATLWQCGECDPAAKLWQSLPESVPVLFNRGMSHLFLGNHEFARNDLRQVVAQLPESSGWHHLGRLYLALAGG